MRKLNRHTGVLISVTMLIAVVFISCSNRDVVNPSETGSIAINATWPIEKRKPDDGSSIIPQNGLAKPSDAPPGVSSIEVTVSGSDISDMHWSFDAARNTGEMNGIPAGAGRQIYVSARDYDGEELYYYQQSNITVNANTTTTVQVSFMQSAPYPPSNLDVSYDIYDEAISLSWDDNSENEDYFIIEKMDVNWTDYDAIDSVSNNTTWYEDYNFTSTGEYYYRVAAKNQGGNSNYSNEAYFSMNSVVEEPSDVIAYWNSGSEIKIEWTDNSHNENWFTIERQRTGDNWISLGSVSADSTCYLDSGFSQGESYYYRVYAANDSVSSGYSESAYFSTSNLPPTIPVITYCVYNNSSMNMTWYDSNSADQYTVYRKDPYDGSFDSVAAMYWPDRYYNDYDIYSEDWYTYKIKAKNVYGFSDISVADSGFADLNGPIYFKNIYRTSVDCGRMAAYGSNLLAVRGTKLLILDLTEPTRPVEAGNYDFGVDIYDVDVQGGYAFVTAGFSGVYSLYISDIYNPSLAGQINPGGDCRCVAVVDTTAYVGTGGNTGLHAVNVKYPGSMGVYATSAAAVEISDVKIDINGVGALAVVSGAEASSMDRGIVFLDVTDPFNMSYKNHYGNYTGVPSALILNGQKAYIAAHVNGLLIIDYSNVNSLWLSGSCGTGNARGITYYNNYVLIADDNNGLRAINAFTCNLSETMNTAGRCLNTVFNPDVQFGFATVTGQGIYIFKFLP